MTAIGVDYTAAHEQGAGIGRYVRELVRALAALDDATPYRLFVAGAQRRALPPPPGANFTWRPTRITPLWFARLWHRLRLPLPVEAFTGRVRLFHATDFTLPPTLPGTRTLLTVHDLSFVRAPETTTPVLKAYLDAVVPRSVRRATHVLADSQATKDDLVELYKTPPDKITVLLGGVNPEFRPVTDAHARQVVRARYSLPPNPYIFSVGTVQPRKNYARLVQALAALGPQHADVHLVIAGGRGWLDAPIYQTVRDLGMGERVHFTGFARDEDLPVLYSDAVCLAYPSLYEGIGLPVLEAMACGTPIVAANSSSLPEIVGDAGFLVDPDDARHLAGATLALLVQDDLHAEMSQKALARAAQFNWTRTAQATLAAFQQVVGTSAA